MSLLSEFRTFALRGNLADLAVGFTVGASFTTVAQSLVRDIIMPPLALVLGGRDFSDRFVLLRPGPSAPPPYATLADAQAAGAVTLNYGQFLNAVFAFFVVAIAMFVVIRVMNRVSAELEERFADHPQPGEPTEKKCPFCRTTIPFKAVRCPHCTSFLEESARQAATSPA
jgi:large conductance mechanosensitive channel